MRFQILLSAVLASVLIGGIDPRCQAQLITQNTAVAPVAPQNQRAMATANNWGARRFDAGQRVQFRTGGRSALFGAPPVVSGTVRTNAALPLSPPPAGNPLVPSSFPPPVNRDGYPAGDPSGQILALPFAGYGSESSPIELIPPPNANVRMPPPFLPHTRTFHDDSQLPSR